MSTLSTLLSRSAIASVIALAGATVYLSLAQAHAQEQAVHFCAAVKPGEQATMVAARAQAEPEKSLFTQGAHTLTVMFGQSERYVCDVSFHAGVVSNKAVTYLD